MYILTYIIVNIKKEVKQMKIVGIIAEFNPFHNGHKYLIKKAKEVTGADTVLCIMSGSFTELGNIALVDKIKRAKIALQNGVDVVLELPTIYSTASSEYFARGAVTILNSLRCIDYLCFGSETADIEELKQIANKLIFNDKAIWESITDELRNGLSFAVSRQNAISKFLTQYETDISSLSNNILAIEYIKTLIELKSTIVPIAIKRTEQENVTSATNIRNLLEKKEYVGNYIPGVLPENLVFNKEMYTLLKYTIVSKGVNYISKINEVTEGLENKIYSELNNSKSYDEFIQNIKSKRYQLSKIKRIMINILLDITKEDFISLNTDSNVYAHILAIKEDRKKEILSYMNQYANIPILTSINDDVIKNLSTTVGNSISLDIQSTNIHSIISNENINKDYTNKI